MMVVVDGGDEDGVVVVRKVEEAKKRKKKAPIGKEAEGVGGGQEGNCRPSRAAGCTFIGPDEEKKDWQAAGVDERTRTRRGTGPAPFSLFGHTHYASPIICFAVFSHSFKLCLPMYLHSFRSPKIGESDMLVQLIVNTDGKQVYRKFPD
jgi:hypothetical protein